MEVCDGYAKVQRIEGENERRDNKMQEMTATRRSTILRRIPTLNTNITDRNTTIRNLGEDLETLETQRDAINDVLADYENLGEDVFNRPRDVPVSDFRGQNRGVLNEKLMDMRSAIDSQRNAHRDNVADINTEIRAVRERITTLRTSNSNDRTTISNLRREWRTGNQNMEFPRFPVGGA